MYEDIQSAADEVIKNTNNMLEILASDQTIVLFRSKPTNSIHIYKWNFLTCDLDYITWLDMDEFNSKVLNNFVQHRVKNEI